MKKLKLSLDDLQVSSFRTAADAQARGGTVKANSGCTQFASTCAPSGGASCDACPSANTDCGGIVLYTFEVSYCVCSDQCAFSEFSNCHRC